MKKYVVFLILICAFLLALACAEQTQDRKSETPAASQASDTLEPQKDDIAHPVDKVDILKLANRSADDLDREFGQPVKVTVISDQPNLMPGEFREYKMPGHPKGLSVRFYKNEAKRFNLLLGSPERSANEALLKIFNIDVSNMKKVDGDPLSETWQGTSGGINFETAYGKRGTGGGEFVMLHAEVAR